jgi:hypothetical protein
LLVLRISLKHLGLLPELDHFPCFLESFPLERGILLDLIPCGVLFVRLELHKLAGVADVGIEQAISSDRRGGKLERRIVSGVFERLL